MVAEKRKGYAEILATVQNYEWGLKGSAGFVANIGQVNSGLEVDENKTYAELWMGTHPNGPSKVNTPQGLRPLKEYISEDLPFLFKVLSVGKALSIQAHPDSELAKKLYTSDPKNYRDPNHKPEMAIALTPFEALCGFRPLGEITKNLEMIPEFANLVDPKLVEELKEATKSGDGNFQKKALKSFFAEFISAEREKVCEQIYSFTNRIMSTNRNTTELEELCLRLNSQYPDEVGCFCVFLLNYITLTPGEAIFLAANEPHAYLSGECIECMALSDNVVRAGLTPKFRDVPTLIDMLTYKSYEPSELALKPSKVAGKPYTLHFKPPVKEFAVNKINLRLGEKETVETDDSYSVIICTNGEAQLQSENDEPFIMRKGTILILEKNNSFNVTSLSSELLLFQAFAQSN